MEELSATIGQHLVPAITPLVTILADTVNAFSELDPSTQRFIVVSGVLVAALGPIVGALGLLVAGLDPCC